MSTQAALVSPAQHSDTATDLVRRFRELPPGAPVRLGKRTSNLFRFGTDGSDTRRLDTSGLSGVIHIDRIARTAEVQGMTTYEDLVDATLAHGLMPLVVPQLKTITLGGAVAGLGIESTSFRHGLPHESVLEMDVLTGSGELVTATPGNAHADLFAAFPNSYGTLGYALRLVIELQPVAPYVRLTHRRFTGEDSAAAASAEIERLSALGPGRRGSPDVLDGTVFGRGEQYLTVGEFVDVPMPGARVSDYTGQDIFYRSVRRRPVDHLRVRDYLWRWDTDWFWCSRAFGVQNPVVRRLWPRRYRRSDVYRRLVALDRRFGASDRVRRLAGAPSEEPVIQDVEIPVSRLAEFLEVFHRDVGISPVWLCPVRLRGERSWPLYPMKPGELYVNVGFWSAVPRRPGHPADAHNRLIETLVADLGGHKSLYSTVHYDEAEFWERYNGPAYRAVKDRYDPEGRLPGLFAKVVGTGER
ncbi:FAD-binding oxidoreductase [Pseudonocardia bannensis]|uniref:Delta(24)-sterol reductase n=1 Tax=Pseudonocardia bannensis TaxID=630973 RepID=A0A848DGM3_9PSEU|nr:FAD-binding oxidoreductase [Pseudonocardia bannensis]NMH91694.1 FAD-binding oxidoreductase [Pseudonocardia bannensis]